MIQDYTQLIEAGLILVQFQIAKFIKALYLRFYEDYQVFLSSVQI